jgi:hypothetical protein
MAKKEINIGVEGNDGTGDSIRESFRKTNENFNELYAIFGAGGTIRFTTLSDTPDSYIPNTILFVDSNASGVDFRGLASNSAADVGAEDSIQISYDTPGKIVLSTTFRALSQDLSPQLGGPLDGNNKAIARVAITQAAVDEFNAEQPDPQITIDDLVITKGYADNRYVAGALPIRIGDEPLNASSYTLNIEAYSTGNIVVTSHGFDNTINGTPYVFRAEDTDPTGLVSGTTYFLRYATANQLSVHETKAEATVLSQAVAETNKIFVTGIIGVDDDHTFIDAAYDSGLAGFYLSNQAIPRKAIVRRQGDKMTGPLVLHDSPGELAGLASSDEDLQAATKFYVDNTSYSSISNLYVSTKGDDRMRGVPAGKAGTSWSYAYRSINAAARRAEEIIRASEAEPGPYMQTITRDGGVTPAEVLEAAIVTPVFSQARLLIQENIQFVTREITAYLRFKYPTFDFNNEIYESDLELILNSIAFDINRGPSVDATANFLTRLSAEKFYADADSLITITRQLPQTLDAVNTARDMVAAILLNRPFLQKPITAITQSSIARVTSSVVHGLVNGNQVIIKNVSGMTQVNEQIYYVRNVSPNAFELFTDSALLVPVNSSSFGAYTSGGVFGIRYQTDESQFFDVGNDADATSRTAVSDKFNLVTNIMENGIDAGASIVYGSTYKVIVNNGGLSAIDQGVGNNIDILPGKILVGKISGAQGRIVSLTTNDAVEGGQDKILVHLIKPIDFIPGEDLEFDNFVKRRQVTIFIESGQYEEDYPIKVSANVSVVGDEFRRVIIRPKDRVSQSPWAGTYFYRDLQFDGTDLVTGGARFYNQVNEIQGRFGYHYLENAAKLVNTGTPVNNPGSLSVAANILQENKKFIQEEVIEYINQNYQDLLYDKSQFNTDLSTILDEVAYDIVLGTNYNQVLEGLRFSQASSIYRDPYLRQLWATALNRARTLVAALPAVISNATATTRSNAAFNEIIDIIQNGVISTETAANALTFGTIASTLPNEVNAKDQLRANRDFIAAEITAYINFTYPRLEYNSTKCARDVRYIVDALSYDVLYGGNFGTRQAAISYFVNAVSQLGLNQRDSTVDAYNRLSVIVGSIVRGIAITPTSGNALTQQRVGVSPASTTEATTVTNLVTVIKNQINNGNLLTLPSAVFPSLTAATPALIDVRSAINSSTGTIVADAISTLDAAAVYTYNQAKCRRDVGLIINALSADLDLGGDEYSTEVQGEYYSSYIQKYNNGGFGGQENVTKGAITYITQIASRLFEGTYSPGDLWQDPLAVNYIEPDFQFGTAELDADNTVSNLINKIIFVFDPRYNPPKRNDQLDVFLMNDATILRNMTVQGQGGFMCTLDPDGQILTKSPYIQTGSSFSQSINKKAFRGGMFVDAYVGNLPATITAKTNAFTLSIRSDEGQGLRIRPPQLPCPFYIEGRRYQVNAISDYDQAQGTAIIYLNATSNRGDGYLESQFDENTGQVVRPLYLQTAGNRSMLGNDFTQINDLGYGLVTTNGAFSEMVSMFTYYCQAAYYACNGSEIRSLNGSNGYGNFGLVSEGADPNEIPDQVTYELPMVAPARMLRYLDEGDFTNIAGSSVIFVTDMPYDPLTNSVVTINHGGLIGVKQYNISVVRYLGDGSEAGDVVKSGIQSISAVAGNAARTVGTYSGKVGTGGTPSVQATYTIQIVAGGATTVTIEGCGQGYAVGNTITIPNTQFGGTGTSITFTVAAIYGNDGVIVLPASVYNNKVYRLQLSGTPAGTNGDFYSTLQADVSNGTLVEFRLGKSHIFNNANDPSRLVTRPSTAINFDESDDITYRSIGFAAFDSVGEPLDADSIQTTFEIQYDHVEMYVDVLNVTGTTGGTIGNTQIKVNPEKEGFALSPSEIARLTRDIAGRQPGTAGYSGGMLFTWAGRTHQIINYTPIDANEATITISGTNVHNLAGAGTGIAQTFTSDKVLRAGLAPGSTAEITISISLCRATGHDFTQIGTGGFNTSNYPNVILGDPLGSLAPYYSDAPNATSAQVWERRKGRVFWMSTDQFGFFRVGKFFEVDQGQGSIKFSGEIGITGATALGFIKGVTIDEFSIDDSMADESDTKVPVEKAIVSYINKRLGRDKNDTNVTSKIGPGFLPLSGSAEMQGNLLMGNQRITNLGAPGVDPTAAVNKAYVDDAVSSFDTLEDQRNVSLNRIQLGDFLVGTGKKKIFVTPPSGGVFTTGDTIRDVSSTKTGIVVDVKEVVDEILGSAPGFNLTIITYTPSVGSFNLGEDIVRGPVSANIVDGPIDEVGNARESTDSVINVTVTRTDAVYEDGLTVPIAELNFQIENDTIVNADINSNASILQSKLLLERASPLANSTGLYGVNNAVGQTSRGLSAYDFKNFTEELQLTLSNSMSANAGDVIRQGSSLGVVVTTIVNSTTLLIKTSNTWLANATVLTRAIFTSGVEQTPTTLTGVNVTAVGRSGYIGLKERSIGFDKLETIATNNVLGRTTAGTGAVELVSFDNIVDEGLAVQDKDFTGSEIIQVSGQRLVFNAELNIADGAAVSQAGSGATGTVQGQTFSETSFIVVSTTGTFNNTGAVTVGGVPIGVPLSAASISTIGSAMVRIADGIYGTTVISTGAANNSIARRTADGKLQAEAFIIGGSASQEILTNTGGLLSFKTPVQGVILTASGGSGGASPTYPVVQMPGSLNVGVELFGTPTPVVNSTQGLAQSNVASLNGKGFVSAPWLYSNFVQAIDNKATAATGISLGVKSGFTSSAANTIVLVANSIEAIKVNSTETQLFNSFKLTSSSIDRFTVASATGNTVVGGTLRSTGNFDVATTRFTVASATGNTVVGGTLDITGNTTLTADLTVNGNTTIGNANTDTVSVTARVASNIEPSTNNTRNLGLGTLRWNTVFATIFDGTALTARYADLAENYQADAEYEPGTVLVFGGSAEVTITDTKADHRVAGVVSTNPAYLMNNSLQGTNVVSVALQGRVPCKILGKAKKGDLLVSSAVPGYAMVSNTPTVGTVIGKALEDKADEGKGIIEAVVGRV